jgi:hypothetical protein
VTADQDTSQRRPEGGLRQIETNRRRREPLTLEQTESFRSREAKGWTPQSGPSGVIDSWWEMPDRPS